MKKRILFTLLYPVLVFSQNQQEMVDAMALMEKSELFYQKSQLDSAYHYAKQSFNLFNTIGNDSLIHKSLLRLITVSNDETRRNAHFGQAKKIAKETRNTKFLTEVYYTMGRIFFNERDYPSALPLFLKVDSTSKKLNLVNETTIWSVLDRSEISRRTFTHAGVEAAHELQNEALEMAKQIKSEKLIYEIYLRLVDMNGLIGNPEQAKHFIDLVLPYYKKNDDVQNLTRVYLNFVNYYYYVNEYEKAGQKLEEGITYLRTKNDSVPLARMIGMYGTFYRKRMNNCKRAVEQLEEAKGIYDKLGSNMSQDYMHLMEDLAHCSAEINDYESAYSYYQLTYEIKKDLVKKANNDLTRKLETKYQTEKKEQEIALLKSQNELAELQKTNQRNLLLAGIGLTSLAGIFFFVQYRNRQKTTNKLKELDAAKSHFFANISHEFRTPLTLIQSPIDEELNKNNLEDTQRDKFNLIKRNSQRLLGLVDQLLTLSKIESRALTLRVQETDLNVFLGALSSSFVYALKQKHIEFVPKIDIETKGLVDVDVLEKIISNLLSNALKYTPEHGIVKLHAEIDRGELSFQISNSGKGLTIEELENIFNKFYQVDSSQQGYGIGLTLVKELTQAHKGSITVSNKDNLTTFMIRLPINKSAYHSTEIAAKPKLPSFETKSLAEEKETDFDDGNEKLEAKDKPILLIVEDQIDMRNFIKKLFTDSHKVIEAKNGKEGIDKALRYIPDIIISDIMMPEVDGLVVSETLKKDQRTSHIPIVMLTAKADDLDKIKGLETGVDDYITKPFKTKLLQVKVRSLLDNRAKLQEHYNHEVVLKPAIFSYNKTEEKFFAQLQNIINDKLQNPNFKVTDFCKFIGMSRMQLHRKLKATLGVTASEFLRTERLKAAKTLLENSQLSISEVAYTSGFNDANYFGKSFKKLFKMAPIDYKDRFKKS